MQITNVTQYHLEHAMDEPFHPTWIPSYPQSIHECELFEIETDEGITGYAASPSFAGGLDYEAPLSYFLLGEDPHNITGIRKKLESIGLIGPRSWHVEHALWDIIGKDAGKPVYELLGGAHAEIPVYASTGQVMDADERIDYIERRIAEGFEAVKLRITDPEQTDIVREIREAFPELTLMVDANKGWAVRVMDDETAWSYSEALAVARDLESIGGVAWLEEPLDRHDFDGYVRLREATDIAIAGGEFDDGVWQLHEALERGAYDIIQPDAALATGIEGGKEIAAHAAQNGVEFVPHTWTNGLGFVANLHLVCAVGGRWCEYSIEPPWTPAVRDFMLTEPLTQEGGTIAPPSEPGLGVEIDPAILD